MARWIIALLFAVSAATWLYTKMARQSGAGNSRNALIAAIGAGVFLFLIVLSLLSFVL